MQAGLDKCQSAVGEMLSRCLVEGDEQALALARRMRRRTLFVSLALEAALLSAVVLLPLLATGERLKTYYVLVRPPYRGSPLASAERQAETGGRRRPATSPRHTGVIYHPPRVPSSVTIGDAAQSDRNGAGAEISPPGIPDGLLPPVGNTDPRDFVTPPRAPVPPPVEQKRPLPRSEGVQQALLIHRVEPAYPPLARQMHLEGTVQLRAIIGRDGTVSSLELLSGHPILAQAALGAVSQWRYRPTLLNGQPIEVDTHITVIFQLRR